VAKIVTDGVEIVAYGLQDASTMATIHLQQATGLKRGELATLLTDPTAWVNLPPVGQVSADTAADILVMYLSEHTRGNFVPWEEMFNRPAPRWILSEDEKRQVAEREAAQDPQAAGTGTPAQPTPAVPDEQPTAATRATRPRSPSTAKSPGSRTRSASGSSRSTTSSPGSPT
jgi:hypothetical protein